MKIKALTAVRDGKKYHPPGDEWECRKATADQLISWGGAEKVVDPEPEPNNDQKTETDPENE